MTARWLYHALLRDEWARTADPYAPVSLASEGFVHASYRDDVRASAELYFPAGSARVVLRIDPRIVGARIEDAATPRGAMPHVYGSIPKRAIVEAIELDSFDPARMPDRID